MLTTNSARLIAIIVLVSLGGCASRALLPLSSLTSIVPDPLWQEYDRYREPTLTNRFFKHSDLVPLIEKHAKSGKFRHEVLGTSVQGRSIHHLTIGNGKIKVLLWSQMHGDESTATMALFDLFNFFTTSDQYDSLRSYLLQNLELHFVPMLNPDGAEVWKRRNAFDIDINRDARMLNTPEGRILKDIAQKLKPDFGFNLHDQGTGYAAGPAPESATISFLAPAYNFEKDMNAVRTRATKLILVMNRFLQQKAPGHVGKYNDDHDPRCFGDNLQGWGTSIILIESGGYPGDGEKQFIRKLNFHALLTAFQSIASKEYEAENLATYESIPENRRSLYDMVVRNVTMEREGQTLTTHIGIGRNQIRTSDARSVFFRGYIEELGDLDRNYGYEDHAEPSLRAVPGKVREMTKEEWQKLTLEEELALIKQGYLFVKWANEKTPGGPVHNHLLNLTNGSESPLLYVSPGQPASFLLTRDGNPVFAVVNGFWIDLNKKATPPPNVWGY